MWQLSDKAVVESWSVTSTTTGIATRAEERFDRDIELCYRSQYRAKLRNDTEIMFSCQGICFQITATEHFTGWGNYLNSEISEGRFQAVYRHEAAERAGAAGGAGGGPALLVLLQPPPRPRLQAPRPVIWKLMQVGCAA